MSELPVFYYQGGRVTWGEYLAAEQQGRTANALQKLAKESATHRAAVETAMRRQGDQMAASSAALATSLARGLAEVGGKIDGLHAPLEHIGDSIDSLHADYLLGTSLLLNQVRLVGQRLEDIGGLLGSIDSRLADWDQNTALAKQRKGLECLQRGLWPEALDAFKASIAHDPLNYHVQYLLGLLHLEGRDSSCDLVNLPEAVRCFELAIRYAQDLAAKDPEAKQHARLAHFHAAVAQFAHANDQRLQGLAAEARESLRASLAHAHAALEYSPRFGLALYQGAKAAAALGECVELLPLLRRAAEVSPRYARKGLTDPDFQPFFAEIQDALSSYHEELKASCRRLIATLRPTVDQAEAWHHPQAVSMRRAITEGEEVLAGDDLGETQHAEAKLRAWQDGDSAARVAYTVRSEHKRLKTLAEDARDMLSKLSPQQSGAAECRRALEVAIESALIEFPALAELQKAEAPLQRAMAEARTLLAAEEARAAADSQLIADARVAQAQSESRWQEERRLRFRHLADEAMIGVPLVVYGVTLLVLLLTRGQMSNGPRALTILLVPPAGLILAAIPALALRAAVGESAWRRLPEILMRSTLGPVFFFISYFLVTLIVGAIIGAIGIIFMLLGKEMRGVEQLFEFGFWGVYLFAFGHAWRVCYRLQRGD